MALSFTTPVVWPEGMPWIEQRLPMLLMGSCFASEMGERLLRAKFDCDLNPFGVLYNPLSIAQALCEILDGRRYTADDLFCHEGLWHSWMHHGDFSAPSAEEVVTHINTRIDLAHQRLPQLRRVVLTMGSAYVYRLADGGRVVGNCHKMPERSFRRERLSVGEVTEALSAAIERLLRLHPEVKLLLTVSPIRHLRDGLHENQLSKSTLLLAADALCRRFPGQLFYLPIYEVMMDELRDYRFYADDLVHPSSLALDYIWNQLIDRCFTADAKALMQECEAISKALTHRPLHPGSEAYKRFLEQTLLKIERLNGKFPNLDLQNERETCYTLLNRYPI
ncbi:MAG: GSCFA domain-containing protein [Bacteroides sp.]